MGFFGGNWMDKWTAAKSQCPGCGEMFEDWMRNSDGDFQHWESGRWTYCPGSAAMLQPRHAHWAAIEAALRAYKKATPGEWGYDPNHPMAVGKRHALLRHGCAPLVFGVSGWVSSNPETRTNMYNYRARNDCTSVAASHNAMPAVLAMVLALAGVPCKFGPGAMRTRCREDGEDVPCGECNPCRAKKLLHNMAETPDEPPGE